MKSNLNYSNKFKILKGGKISLIVSALLGSMSISFASPSGGTVTSGTANISQNGNTTNINQSTNKASINWQNFDIASNETVNFNQPNSSSVTLNRVVGLNNSVINGALNANGQVILVNPNGIVFNQGSTVNVGGLIATTKNITNQDFQNDNYIFDGNSEASILNKGTITAQNYVAMMGKEVVNEGTILATLGKVELAGGDKFTLNLNGNSLLNLSIDEATLNALIENKGLIKADGGVVHLTTKALNSVLDGVVNNTGVIEAKTLSANEKGEIILFAHGGEANIDGTLDASSSILGDGGFIETSGKDVNIQTSFVVTTKAENGENGEWLIDPVNIVVSASGGDITGSTIASALSTTDVTLDTSSSCIGVTCNSVTSGSDGDIIINDVINVTNNSSTNTTFKLLANRDILWMSGGKLDATSGTNGVNVTLISNQDADSSGGILIGGLAGSTYRNGQSSIYGQSSNGSLLDKALIKTNGGNFSATADNVSEVINASLTVKFAEIDVGLGSIFLTAKNTNPGTGNYDSRHGIAMEASTENDFLLKAEGGITLTGSNNNPGNYFGISMSGGTYLATGAGEIRFNGSSGTGGYGIATRTYSNNLFTHILSNSGDITFNTANISTAYDGTSNITGLFFGAKSATGVTSSTADIIFNVDNIASLGKMTVETEGILAIESRSSSWASAQTVNLSLLTVNQLGGVKIGKIGNSSDLSLSLPIILGNIEINGNDTILNSNLFSSIGDITVNTNLVSSSAILVEANNGDINLNGNVTTTDSSNDAIIFNAGKSKNATDNLGGNIIIGSTPTINYGNGGRAVFYSGKESASTGLTTLVSLANVRNYSDETTIFSPILVSGLYAIYRGLEISSIIPTNDYITSILNNKTISSPSLDRVSKTTILNSFENKVDSSYISKNGTTSNLSKLIKNYISEKKNIKDSKVTLVSDTGGEKEISIIESDELIAQNGGELRVALSPDSFVELVNGGVNLPNGVSQEFYVVEDKE